MQFSMRFITLSVVSCPRYTIDNVTLPLPTVNTETDIPVVLVCHLSPAKPQASSGVGKGGQGDIRNCYAENFCLNSGLWIKFSAYFSCFGALCLYGLCWWRNPLLSPPKQIPGYTHASQGCHCNKNSERRAQLCYDKSSFCLPLVYPNHIVLNFLKIVNKN